METKPTLSVSAKPVQQAKTVARRCRVPLSHRLVKNRLTAADAGERFLDKWQGAFKLDPAALKDERVAAIMAKHVR